MARKKVTVTEMKKLLSSLLVESDSLGLTDDYFFMTTLKRYNTQIEMLDSLEQAMVEDGMTVTKEYVKGRANYYVNPAVREYNNTVDSANKTVATLIKIYNEKKSGDTETGKADPLLAALRGEGD